MTVSLAITLVIAYFWGMTKNAVFTATQKGLAITIEILFLILGAIFLLEILKRTGAMDTLTNKLSKVTKDHRILAVIVAVMFVALIEGAAGFGTPAALAAPILLNLGFPPTAAISTALMGDTVPTTFGALGTPIIYGIGSNYPTLIDPVTKTAALILAIIGLFLPSLVVFILTKKFGGKTKDAIATLPYSLSVAAITMTAYYLSSYLGAELPAVIAGITGIVTGVLLIKLAPKKIWRMNYETKKVKSKTSLAKSILPYALLSALLIFTRVPYIKQILTDTAIPFGPHNFYPFYHPFILFMIAALVTIIIQKLPKQQTIESIKQTLKKSKAVVIPLLAILILVQIVQYSKTNTLGLPGMPQLIAQSIKLPTLLYILISPLIGGFGAFIAGSNTVSNLLFGQIQYTTAMQLSIKPSLILSLQTAGGALGNMVAIHNIIAASAVLGIYNQEAKILKITALPAIILCLLAGVIGIILHLT
jgi:lactate permease